jgi:hypothetical protein
MSSLSSHDSLKRASRTCDKAPRTKQQGKADEDKTTVAEQDTRQRTRWKWSTVGAGSPLALKPPRKEEQAAFTHHTTQQGRLQKLKYFTVKYKILKARPKNENIL